MPASTDHTHHIRVRQTQLEMSPAGLGGREEDYDRKLRVAQEELERIQQQSEELRRKKQELEELTTRKREFVSQQVELTERMTSAITQIDRGLFEIRNEANDLEQCRACFASHLDKLQKINPEGWTRENLQEKLERATLLLDMATDEYEQAVSHFEGTRSATVFGNSAKGRRSRRGGGESEFVANLKNGIAFNLPIIILGGVALIVYLLR